MAVRFVPQIMAPAALPIAQHFPGSIERQDRAVVPTGIGVMALHQGAVGRLDLGSGGGWRHAEHAIGVSRGIGSSQGNASANNTALPATLGTQAAKLARLAAQQKTPA
jgi:hypothetical protein